MDVTEMGRLAMVMAADIDRAGLPTPAVLSVDRHGGINVQFSGQDAVSTDALGGRYGLSLIDKSDPYHAPTLHMWRGKAEVGGTMVTMSVYCGAEKD